MMIRMGSDAMCATVTRAARIVVAVAVVTAAPAGAMTQTQQPSQAQPVMLRIRPHVGDTLRMRMEQHVEMSDADAGDGKKESPAGFSMNASMCICTCAIVERSTAMGTELRSYTDSVIIRPASAASLPPFAQTKRALEGKMVRLRVAPDGAISIVGGDGDDAKSEMTQLPAMLPDTPVSPGDMWTRDLKIPVSATRPGAGSVRAMFRLDSLSADGSMAYISMQGTFAGERPAKGSPQDETSGTIRGTMQIDRKLAWITDSRMTVTLVSTVRPPGSTVPARVRMKVTQSMRALPKS
jgi:hypothetical protein